MLGNSSVYIDDLTLLKNGKTASVFPSMEYDYYLAFNNTLIESTFTLNQEPYFEKKISRCENIKEYAIHSWFKLNLTEV